MILRALSAPTRAYVWAVHDGDTLTCLVNVPAKATIGVDLWAEVPIRLAGCNARELATAGGVEARDNLRALLPVGAAVTVTVVGADKYGTRMDGRIRLADGQDLTALLVGQGWAAAWDGHGVKPVPTWPRL